MMWLVMGRVFLESINPTSEGILVYSLSKLLCSCQVFQVVQACTDPQFHQLKRGRVVDAMQLCIALLLQLVWFDLG